MGGFIHLSKTIGEQNRSILKKRKGTFQLMDEFSAKSLDGDLDFPSNPAVTEEFRVRMERKFLQVKRRRIALGITGIVLVIVIIWLALSTQVGDLF